MAYVLIKDNIVVQKQPNKEKGFVEAPDNVICGMRFENGNYLPSILSEEDMWAAVRSERDALLKQNDPYFSTGHPLNSPEMDAYRQALLDLPQNFDKPEDVVWPDNPLEAS